LRLVIIWVILCLIVLCSDTGPMLLPTPGRGMSDVPKLTALCIKAETSEGCSNFIDYRFSIQHDTWDELCAVRGTLSSEEPGDPLGESPKETLPPSSLCVLLSGVALGRRCLDCSLIYW
jgi:hypothetical protein